MDLSYPPEAEQFRKEIRTWLETHLPDGWFEPGFELKGADRARFNQEWVQQLYEGGWICASWPKEYGGKGLSIMENVVLAEEFARAKAPLRADFFGDTLVGPTILQWGTEEQKREFLPQIMNGKVRWCQGFSEPDSGSDLASLKTTAVLDGDEWVINGQKVWTTQAQFADYIFLLARTDPSAPKHKGISYLLVPMKQPGIEVPRHHAAGRHGRVQRGLLRQRPLPQGQRRRRAQQRLGRRQHDAGPRAGHVGHDELSPLRRGTRRHGGRGTAQRRHRRSVDPPAAHALPHEDRDPAHQRAPLAVGHRGQAQGSGRAARSAPPTRCSGPRCTATPWSWRSTSSAPSRC